MSSNPLSSSCGNLAQLNRQTQLNNALINNMINKQQLYSNNNNNLPINRRQSIENWQASKAGGAMLQNVQQQNVSILPYMQYLQNGLIKPNKQIVGNPYLQKRRNLSLTDINSANLQLLAANAGLNATFLPYDLNSLSQSMDELIVDEDSYTDDDNYSSISSKKHRQFNRKNSSKQQVNRSSSRGSSMNDQNLLNKKLVRRSQSSAQLLNPYDFESATFQNQMLANLYYAQPILNATSISPASSIRSLEALRRKNSVNSMLSNRTLVNNNRFNDLNDEIYKSKNNSKYRRSRDRSDSSSRRSKSLSRSKSQTSNRSGKASLKPSYDKSNRCMSSESDELNDEETEFSESSCCSNLDDSTTTTQSEQDDKRQFNQTKKQWKCKICTFVNRIQMNICEMCSKSRMQTISKQDNKVDKIAKQQDKQDRKHAKQNGHLNKNKAKNETSIKDKNESKKELDKQNYIEFTDELIKQQELVEKELLRRIANEKLVEKENLRIEQEQLNEKINDKSRIAINSGGNKKKFSKEETNDSIKMHQKTTTNSSPVSSSSPLFSLNNSNNLNNNSTITNRNVSKIKPPSISLKQQINQLNNNKLNSNETNQKKITNKLIKTHSLDSNLATTANKGRHREEIQFKKEQFSVGKNTNVQQYANQQYNQRNFTIKSQRSEEQKSTNSHLINDQSNLNYDKKILDGMQMFKLLKEAERKDFLAEELEIALSFNSTDPIGWLEENWSNMNETTLTLANNQLLTICEERNVNLITVNDEDARNALRYF